MNMAVSKNIDPLVRKRNRILLLILLGAILLIAIGGVLYLREYGFATNQEQNLYH